MEIKAAELLQICQGEMLFGNPEKQFYGVAIDSRKVRKGDLFIPFRGEHTDGHLFIEKAGKAGAAGTLYSLEKRPAGVGHDQFFIIKVDDTLEALQNIATAYRERFKLPVIGITGSTGKTTTKDLVAGVLSGKFNLLKTTGNLNNEIGLPLTITKLEDYHQVAVLEMGMTARGEINKLCTIAKPEIGIITNIGIAHIEQLGSIEAITEAKYELLDYLGSGGIAVLNSDDSRLLKIGKRYPGKAYYYGFNQGDIECLELSQRGEKSFFRVRFPDKSEGWFESPLPGREAISNALAALTLGFLFDLSLADMQKGLKSSEISAGRLQIKEGLSGVKIIDDSYNANPDSFRAAINVLDGLGGRRKAAVIGDMLELGHEAHNAHRLLGKMFGEKRIDCLVAIGDLAALAAKEAKKMGIDVFSCKDHEEALAILSNIVMSDDWSVLVKGSRGMKMDLVVQGLEESKGVSC